MVEKGIRERIRYTVANNKYMKHYNKNRDLSYLFINNLYGWAMSQKVPISSLNLKINLNSIKSL